MNHEFLGAPVHVATRARVDHACMNGRISVRVGYTSHVYDTLLVYQQYVNIVQNIAHVKFSVVVQMNFQIGKTSAKANDAPFGKICT